ncbi:glycosyltransferase [Thermogladius sp. 4427co]|uniref:glycosyltransferase n=1 Tax=Thermogladius sp. 4427co TaxID=3450718 RepID=UPI003F7A7192
MNALEAIGVLGVILFFIPQSLFLLLYAVLSFYSSRYREKDAREGYSGELVSVIIPVRREPAEYIERALENLSKLAESVNLEVIIVSDDPGDYLPVLRSIIGKWSSRLRVYYIWRAEPKGFRSGALNTGLFAAAGDYIYVLDVDSSPDPCLFTKGVGLLKSDEKLFAVVGRWAGRNTDTRLSKAISLNMEFVVNVLFKARSVLGLNIPPLGTGTIFKARVLREELRGWDEDRIQDDMDIGARAFAKGYRVEYIDSCRVYVEVPRRYSSLKTQQERWAYGATDVAVSRASLILRGAGRWINKAETIFFLSQYVIVLLYWIGFLVTGSISLFLRRDLALEYYPLTILWLLSQALFSYSEQRCLEGPMWDKAVNMGRIAAVTVSLSPSISKGVIRALLRIRMEYKRTPKGVYEKYSRAGTVPGELILLAVLSTLLFMFLYYKMIVLSIITCMNIAGLVYTLIRWGCDIVPCSQTA